MSIPPTPGPWRFVKQSHLRYPTCTQFVIDSKTRKLMFVAEVWPTNDDPHILEEVEANTRLVAAAPTMHQALRDAQETLKHVRLYYNGPHPTEIDEALDIVTRAIQDAEIGNPSHS